MAQEIDVKGNAAHGDDNRAMDKPVKIGAVSMTTNPTKVADKKRAELHSDAIGRQLVVPYQVRELVSTAYLSLGTNSETTLLAGIAGTFLDLYQITFCNTSTAALGAATSVQVDLRDATAGGVVHSVMVNDDASTTINFNPPLPQNTAAGTWTAQLANGDLSGTTLKISATFVQNV